MRLSLADHNERLARLREQFYAGSIGEPTLRTSLLIMGLRGQELDAEVNLIKRDRPERLARERKSS